MRKGQRVVVTAEWSSFLGRRGTVSAIRPGQGPMLLLDGEAIPMAFGADECEAVVGEQSEPSLTGAE